jgi:type VII secretion integral membrane protein EccD
VTATADRPVTQRADALVPASSRVTLLVGENHQIDLLLPAAVPLNKLADPTRDAINQRLRSMGASDLPARAFVFARAAGMTLLAGNLSLAAQGVADGDLLAFVPGRSAQRYEPNIENVSAAIAKWAKEHFPPVTTAVAARVAIALSLVALTVAAVLVWRQRWAHPGGWVPATIFAVTALILAGLAALSPRLAAEPYMTSAASWAALSALVLAGATAPPSSHPGAPHAFLAAGVALVGAAGLGRMTGRYWAAATTVVTVSSAVLGAAAARMFFEVPGQRIATVVLVGVLTVSLAAPSIGRRLARVPHQSFDSITGKDMYERSPSDPEDTISPVADSDRDITLTGAQVGEVAVRSNRVLMGVLLGNALTQVAASWCVIHPGAGSQWRFVVVAAAIALIAVLRARAFRDRRHAITVVTGAALSLFAIPTHYGLAADPATGATGLWAAGIVVAIAICALVAGAVVPRHVFSEPVREIAEYIEYVATAVVVVFAAWSIDLVHFVRYH